MFTFFPIKKNKLLILSMESLNRNSLSNVFFYQMYYCFLNLSLNYFRDLVILALHFNSFEFETSIMSQTDYFSFFCKYCDQFTANSSLSHFFTHLGYHNNDTALVAKFPL